MQTRAQLLEHYEIERSLADQLKSASREERRRGLYTRLYDELFRRVSHHPQLTLKVSREARQAMAERQAKFLCSIAAVPRPVYLEVGPGDCLIALTMAKHAREVFAVDVSMEITRDIFPPPNFALIQTDGSSVDVPSESIDIAFSNQLMEHLHPDDATTQLHNIFKALKPGGRYFIVTPSRASGPHDVSQHFGDVATGFHLHEYLLDELIDECRRAGFSSFSTYVGKDGVYLRVPLWLVRATERLVAWLPRRAGKLAPLRLMLGLRVVARRGV